MRRTFEEIRKDYTTRYPDLAGMSDGDFCRAAIALATRETISIQDLVVLSRVAGSSALQDTDKYDDLVAFGKKGGYFDEE